MVAGQRPSSVFARCCRRSVVSFLLAAGGYELGLARGHAAAVAGLDGYCFILLVLVSGRATPVRPTAPETCGPTLKKRARDCIVSGDQYSSAHADTHAPDNFLVRVDGPSLAVVVLGRAPLPRAASSSEVTRKNAARQEGFCHRETIA